MITTQIVIESLNRAVKLKGADYIDPRSGIEGDGCEYDTIDAKGNSVPLCIVGQVFYDLHINKKLATTEVYSEDHNQPIVGVATFEQLIGETGIDNGPDAILSALNVECEIDAARILLKAQVKQDSGEAWGQAVADAIKEVVGS